MEGGWLDGTRKGQHARGISWDSIGIFSAPGDMEKITTEIKRMTNII